MRNGPTTSTASVASIPSTVIVRSGNVAPALCTRTSRRGHCMRICAADEAHRARLLRCSSATVGVRRNRAPSVKLSGRPGPSRPQHQPSAQHAAHRACQAENALDDPEAGSDAPRKIALMASAHAGT